MSRCSGVTVVSSRRYIQALVVLVGTTSSSESWLCGVYIN